MIEPASEAVKPRSACPAPAAPLYQAGRTHHAPHPSAGPRRPPMHFEDPYKAPAATAEPRGSWIPRGLNRYHWFVLTVAALGWLFDTMDQQLFNLARVPAMRELLVAPATTPGATPSPAD